MIVKRTYRRMNEAIRLAHSGEAEKRFNHCARNTRMKHGDAFNSPGAVRDYLRLLLHNPEHEVFVVLLLVAQNRVLATEELFQDTLTQTSIYPREPQASARLKH